MNRYKIMIKNLVYLSMVETVSVYFIENKCSQLVGLSEEFI